MTEQVKRIMAALQVDEQTAREIAETDKAIDRGEPMPFDLSPEQEKATRTYRQADRKKPVIVEGKPRPRKADEDKRYLVQLLENAVCGVAEDLVEVVNPERELVFHYNGKKYKITLSAPRS